MIEISEKTQKQIAHEVGYRPLPPRLGAGLEAAPGALPKHSRWNRAAAGPGRARDRPRNHPPHMFG